MKKGCVITLGIVGVLVLAALIALYVANQKYEFLWAAPEVSAKPFVGPDTCMQVVLRPDLARDQIHKLLPGVKVPSWVIDKILPYKIGLFFSDDPNADKANVTAFINERRLGPIIQQAVHVRSFHAAFPTIKWSSDTLVRKGRGKMVLKGVIPVSPKTVELAQQFWTGLTESRPLELDGKHLVEAAVDNRNGAAYAVIASLAQPNTPTAASYQDPNTVKLLAAVPVIRANADLVEGDKAKINLEVHTNPNANMMFAIKLVFDGIIPQLNESLNKAYGVTLEGSSEIKGNTLVGHYTLSHVDRLLGAAGVPVRK